MSQMSKIEPVRTSDVDGQTVRLLHDDELDAVSGGKAGGDKQKYMIVTMSECLISSF